MRLFVAIVLVALVQGENLNTPMVAFLCNKPPMFLQNGVWTIAEGDSCPPKADDILDFCRKVYPGREIDNVVEYGKRVTISQWCQAGKKTCHHPEHSVEPYVCMEGKFKSKALMVPEHCIFDHIYGSSDCKTEPVWKVEGRRSCRNRDSDMNLASFAILAPCPNMVSVFRGVEFVCCPKSSEEDNQKIDDYVKDDDYEDEVDDEEDDEEDDDLSQEYEEEEEDNTDKSAEDEGDDVDLESLEKLFDNEDEEDEDVTDKPLTPVTSSEDNDVYTMYLKNSPGRYLTEHEYFGRAKTDLQKHHHEKVTKMMKEWASARQHVQELKSQDPKAAEDLNREITFRFQKTYEALEQEGLAEKKQLTTLHQQRVQTGLNEHKRRAMEKYMQEINHASPDSSAILHALKHYVRTEEKDRLHSLNHFKHIRDTYPADARPIRTQVLDHMRIIQERIDQALEMLNRVPTFQSKIQNQIEEYLQTFHELDVGVNNILVKPYEDLDETNVVDKFKQDSTDRKDENVPDSKVDFVDVSEESEEVSEESNEDEAEEQQENVPSTTVNDEDYEDEHAGMEEEPVRELIKPAQPAHIQTNNIQVAQKQYDRGVRVSKTRSLLPAGGVLGIAVASITVFVIVVAGIVVLRKRAARIPGDNGFVEVDQAASPEERHVANMQINGYENPTYKYFETSPPNA